MQENAIMSNLLAIVGTKIMFFQTIGIFRLTIRKVGATKKHSNFTDPVLKFIFIYRILV